MGGKAFSQLLPDASFPRIDAQTYQLLKQRYLGRLKPLFSLVGVPTEAPEKTTFGDLDYLVAGPLSPSFSLDQLKSALGATHVVTDEGDHMPHFAIPAAAEAEGLGESRTYYQVDVATCAIDEWPKMMFYHAHGDLGIILGRLLKEYGLTYGSKGLRISHPDMAKQIGNAPFLFSESPARVLDFLGLSYSTWEAGFPTQRSIFKWVQHSRFFDPPRLKDPVARQKSRDDRPMYQAFLQFVHECEASGIRGQDMSTATVIQDALSFFDKTTEYEARIADVLRGRKVKSLLNGPQVQKWLGFKKTHDEQDIINGLVVKEVVETIRQRVGEDELVKMELDDVRRLALELYAEIRQRAS